MDIKEYENIYNHENTYWWYKILDSLVVNSIKKYFQNRRIKILDAGCGTGRIMEKLSSFGETEGIDFSQEAIKYCILRGQRNVNLANLNEWKSETKKYDLIVSLDVLYHKAIENEEKILKSFNEALNPNGVLIINLPAFNILKRGHDQVVGGAKRFKKTSFSKTLMQSGFKIKTITYRLPILFFAILISKFVFGKKSKTSESDLKLINPFLNNLLVKYHFFENKLINIGINMPFGSSLFVVAIKSNGRSQSANQLTGNLNLISRENFIIKHGNYLKNRPIFRQFFKYSIVGIFNTLIGLGAIFILYNIFNVNYIVSNILGYVLGLINSFIWNKRWTFESTKHYSKEIFPFLIIFIISYTANLITVIAAVEVLRIDPNIAQVLGIGAYTATNFLSNRKWTFSPSKYK